MKALFSALLLIISILPAGAQERSGAASPPPVLPPGPLIIDRVPEMAQWSVTYKAVAATGTGQSASSQKPVASPGDFNAIITKTKSIYHVQIATGRGLNIDKWCIGGAQITTMPNAQLPVVSTPQGKDTYYMDFSKSDFPAFGWISSRNFVGTKNIAGSDCLVFSKHMKAPSIYGEGTPRGAESVDTEAYIDLKTRFPLYLRSGESLTAYQYGTAPSAMLIPPVNIASMLEQRQTRLRQAAEVPPP